MTLSKIAKEAHVSVSTASKAFSGSREVNEQTREAVFRVAKKHGCFKKFYNAKYPKLVIGVLAPEFKSSHYSRYLTAIQKNLSDCELCVSTTDFSLEREKSLVDYYYKHSNVDGLILIDPRQLPAESEEIPVVIIGGSGLEEQRVEGRISVITYDWKAPLAEGVAYLKQRGVSSVTFIGESHTLRKGKLLATLLEEYEIPFSSESFLTSPFRFEEGGYWAIKTLLEKKALPRAVICAYDRLAVGAMCALAEAGLRIPEDVAVLGMNDIESAPYCNPPLASISVSAEETCHLAASLILSHINGESAEARYTVPTGLCLRRSFEIDAKSP